MLAETNWKILLSLFPLYFNPGIHAYFNALPHHRRISGSNDNTVLSTSKYSTTLFSLRNNVAQRNSSGVKDGILSFISSAEIFPQNGEDFSSFILNDTQLNRTPSTNRSRNTSQGRIIGAGASAGAGAGAGAGTRTIKPKLLNTYDLLLLRKGPLHPRTIEVLKDMIKSFDLNSNLSKEEYAVAKDILEDVLKRKKEMPHTNKSMEELFKHDLIIFQTLGFLYIKLEMYQEAREMYVDVIYEIQCVAIGPTHRETLRSLEDIANIYSILNDYDNARKHYLTCYVQRKKLLGMANEDTISTLQHLSNLYLCHGKYEQAQLVGEKGFSKIITSGNTKSIQPSTAFMTLHNLALHCQHDRQYEKAQQLFERCLSHQLRVLGQRNEDTLLTMHNLSTLYHDMEDYESGIRTCQECFVLRKEVLGLNHYDTLLTLSNLGVLYESQGDYAKAKKIYESCYDLQSSTLGANHKDTLLTKECLLK